MKATRNGIHYVLKDSPFHITIQGMTYYFSSRFYLQKFVEFIESNRKDINSSLSHRFKMVIELPVLCDLVLYTKTEKRGFYVVTSEGGILEWSVSLKYVGEKAIVTTLTRRSEDSTPS